MISRRSRNVAILLAILALVLAACGPQATPTPTTAPTDEPAPTEEATAEAEAATEEVVVEEPTEEVVVEEPTEEVVVEEPTEEVVVEEPTEEVVVEEPTEEVVVEEPTEEVVVEEPTEEVVVEEPTEEVVVEMTEVAPEATEAPITTESFNDAGFSFSYPSNYTLDAGNGLYRLSNGDLAVVIINNVTYATVLGGVSFDNSAAALAFYLDRTGYTVGEATADGVAVSLPRRNLVGTASLVDLGGENSAVVLTLGPDADNQPTDVATQVKDSLSIPTILGAALTSDGLSTLATALVRGGLAGTFNAEGAYTVFAPSDDAFAAALEAMGVTADELLANRELLSTVLTYHVVDGVLKASELTDGLELTTLNGAILTVTIVDGTVTITDVAGMSYSVVTADVAASNGVVHVIDGVLSPVPAPEPEATPEATAEATEAGS